MTNTDNKEVLAEVLQRILSEKIVNIQTSLNEVTLTILANHVREVSEILRNDLLLQFDTLIDLCGIDYLTYGENLSERNGLQNKRYAVIYHLLSVILNQRLRLRVIAEDDELPVVESVTDIWPVANWFEREAFDLYGIVFIDHPDLRRILTDYGFIGNPFRKDFPITGYVEMRYDADQKRVVYQPVTIEPREITPHVIREEFYGDAGFH